MRAREAALTPWPCEMVPRVEPFIGEACGDDDDTVGSFFCSAPAASPGGAVDSDHVEEGLVGRGDRGGDSAGGRALMRPSAVEAFLRT